MNDRNVVEISDRVTATERAFLDALVRIVENRPTDPGLAAKAARGLIRPSQSNVAQEAGHSRTLISGANCDFPRVKLEIQKAQDRYRASKRPGNVIAELAVAAEDARLRSEVSRVKEEREEMRRQRDAAFTSSVASGMLALTIRQAALAVDVDVTEMRRLAEQTALSHRPISAS